MADDKDDLVDHISLNRSAVHKRGADSCANHQNFVKLNFFASVSSKFLNPKNISALNFVLLATGLQDRKHMRIPLSSAFCGPC